MKDAVDRLTPLGLMVLTLLRVDDMHPYEMMRLMRIRHDDRLVTITNGTMYHTVARLEKSGLIVEVGVDRDGNRPERTTYSVTDAGVAVALDWVRRELVGIDTPAQFRIALAESHNLDRDEVRDRLGIRHTALTAYESALTEGYTKGRAKGVPLQYLVEVERDLALVRADLTWSEALIARLADDDIPWGTDTAPTDRYLAQREAARA
ncbi:PadR family transcriptional regulator [Microbacterium sp. W1N]|uniref:PadR family transcriptional regulator n=1 Tax=Microbacterium festucae TaxID=2977531 RepID=UPI0021C02868|nr:PadR family transcriptional regulator [Microbacterium festucae]MCT9819343.1 PadR family transcriptional regulator [Microbacterium festucae]